MISHINLFGDLTVVVCWKSTLLSRKQEWVIEIVHEMDSQTPWSLGAIPGSRISVQMAPSLWKLKSWIQPKSCGWALQCILLWVGSITQPNNEMKSIIVGICSYQTAKISYKLLYSSPKDCFEVVFNKHLCK